MIEVFSGCPEEGRPRPCQRRTAKHTIDQKAGKYGISRDFNRVLVERRQYLDSTGAMVDLVKGQPKAIGVTKPMPPVEDEGARNPVNETFDYRVRPIPPLK